MSDAIFWIGFVLLLVVIGLLVKRWTHDPVRTLIRYHMIDVLWNERERIRGYLATGQLDDFEKMFFRQRLTEIDKDLRRLGLPPESLQ